LKMERDTKQIIFYFIFIFLFLTVLSIVIPNRDIKISKGDESNLDLKPEFFSSENGTVVSLKVPAVNPEGKGVPVLLRVEAVKGTGRTLVEIDNLLFWADTQHSIRMARQIAGNVSEKNLDDFNLIYSIKADATAIGGPSAGAAIALATIFALNAEEPKEDIMITGTINHDGTIGPVDNILAKAHAATEFDVFTLLVPLLQSKEIEYEEREYCQDFGGQEVCTMETVPRQVNITSETNVSIIEVKNIEEALEYFKKS
jgi:uncharacterized protein